MKGAFCPSCEEYTGATLGVEKEVYNVRGEPIEVEAEIAICQKCGEKIFDEERDSRNLEKAYSLYRKKHNLLSPDEIRTIREKYGLSQRALSRLLGWGEITIHRYESGAIQDNAHDKLLRLIQDPRNIQKFLEGNRNKLPSYAAARLEKRITSFLQEDKEQAFQISLERLVSHQHMDLTSGFKEFDLEKLKNMILYLVKRLDGVLKVKLNKLLWYCDFLHFKETSVSITGTQYIRLPYGPVPNNFDFITDMMRDEGLLDKIEIIFNARAGVVGEEFTALAEPDESIFSEQEIKVMDFVADKFREYISTSIMNKSHQETAYIKCEDGDIISYEYAKELSLLTEDKLRLIKENIEEFEEIMNTPGREEEAHQFLKNNGLILDLTSIVEPISKFKLGDDYITDFVVQDLPDGYVFVEIEKPGIKLFKKTTPPERTQEFNHAIEQIENWKAWIGKHHSYISSKLEGISTSPVCWLIAGRRTNLSSEEKRRLAEINQEYKGSYKIFTYDDLIDRVKAVIIKIS